MALDELRDARLSGRRMISVVAALSTLAALARYWRSAAQVSPASAVAVTLGLVLSLIAVLITLTARHDRLHRIDIGVLALAVAMFLAEQSAVFRAGYRGRSDESRLGRGALQALLAGANPYTATIPGRTGTRLLDGALVTHYDYPPVPLEAGWLANHVATRLAEPWVLSVGSVVITAVIAFFALPRPWRALAVPVVLGLGMLDNYAKAGFPIVIALPLLCVAVRRWTDIGAEGRLRLSGTVRAVALGCAAATQQLAWFVAPLVVVAVWVVRRGELSLRSTAAVMLRYLGVALLTFAVLNAPFALTTPRAWWHGITAVLTQQAAPYGAGIVLVLRDVIGQTVALQYLSYATALLAAALITVTAVGLRRVAAAVPVFAAMMFVFSTRSEFEFFVFAVPVLLVWAGTTDRDAVARSRPLRIPGLQRRILTTWPRRIAATTLAVAPALMMCGAAVLTPSPLRISVSADVTAGTRVRAVDLVVANESDHVIRAEFSLAGRGHGWRGAGGPVVLPPHCRQRIVLRPERHPVEATSGLAVLATMANPPTLTSVALPEHGAPRPLYEHRRRGTRQLLTVGGAARGAKG